MMSNMGTVWLEIIIGIIFDEIALKLHFKNMMNFILSYLMNTNVSDVDIDSFKSVYGIHHILWYISHILHFHNTKVLKVDTIYS